MSTNCTSILQAADRSLLQAATEAASSPEQAAADLLTTAFSALTAVPARSDDDVAALAAAEARVVKALDYLRSRYEVI